MFKRIYLEISDYCNLSCKFCTSPRKNKTMMSFEQFKIVIDKINGYAPELYLHVLGEPLIHPDLVNMINYAKDYFKVSITTNGRLLNKDEGLLISDFKKMNISLNSALDLPSDKIIEYLDDIYTFIEKRHKLYPDTVFNLRLWAYDSNASLASVIENYLEKLYSIKIVERENIRLKPRVILTYENEFEWPSLNNKYYGDQGSCLGLKTHISILANGNVGVCCLDTLCDSNLGNIFDNNLEEIITSDKAKEIVKGFNDNKLVLDICKHCSYHKN